jgi:hypothetical protein
VPLAHAINYSLIKKRFTIMKTQTSRKAIWRRSLLLVPLLGGLLFSFSGREQVEKDVVPAMVFPDELHNNNVLTNVKNELSKTNNLKINYTDPILEVKENPLRLKINGNVTTLKNLEKDFNKITANKKSSIQLEAKNQITTEIINKLVNHLGVNLENLIVPIGETKVIGKAFFDSKENVYTIPVLELKQNPLNLILNGQQTSLKSLKKDFTTSTDGEKSNLRIEAKGPIDYDLIKEIMSVISKDYLLKIQLSEEAYIQDNTDYENEKSQKEATPEQVAEYNKLAKRYNAEIKGNTIIKLKDLNRIKELYNLMSDAQKKNAEPFPNFPPPPPTPPKVKKGEASLIPPPPPPAPPKSTVDHAKEMANINADFYYNGKSISSDKAIDLLEANSKMNISTHSSNGKRTVNISNKPFTTVNGKVVNNEHQTGSIDINGEKHFYSKKNGVITYYNTSGIKVDKNGKELNKKNRTLLPPPIPENATPSERREMQAAIDHFEKKYKRKVYSAKNDKTGELLSYIRNEENDSTLKSSIADEAKNKRKEMLKNRRRPLYEQFKGMEANGTTFFYEGDKISEAKAIELTKENPKLNVSMQSNNGVSTVHLSKKGITTVNGKLVKKEE